MASIKTADRHQESYTEGEFEFTSVTNNQSILFMGESCKICSLAMPANKQQSGGLF